MRRAVFLLIFLLSGLVMAANTDRRIADYDMVRVAIVREAREINLEVEGGYTYRDGLTEHKIAEGPRQPRTTVRLLDRGIFIGVDVYPYKRLVIVPKHDASIIINNHHFRGNVTFIRTPNNRLTVVNSVNIEDYIKGVLLHEVSNHWPMEALKAQAVATRTYALYSMLNKKDKDYDVTNDIYSQVYGGENSERYRTGLAVDRTAGQILTYDHGKILPAYFHATCGGMTEDARELWDIGNVPPLRGVPCMFCKDSPHFHWKKNFRLKNIQDALNEAGHKIGLIKDISVVDRDRSDRISHLKITARDGQEMIITGKDFRQIIGPNVLKSNNYQIHMQGYYADFIGKGWGHGVGMCQWGARGMSEQGFNYKQILEYYYPGSVLSDYHAVSNDFLNVQHPAVPDEQPE